MSNSNLEELAKEERRAYFKEWRAKNKDKVKQSNHKYWLKKAEQRQKEEAKSHKVVTK